MSRLKISDLSFCENQLPRNSKVQGGLGPLFSFSKVYISSTTDSTGDHIAYFFDNTGNSSQYFVVTNPPAQGVAIEGAEVSTSNDGIISNTQIKAFSINGSLL